MWMHQFKGTVLPVLQAGSSSLATKCVSSEFKFACISKTCLFLGLLAVRKQRHKSAFPIAVGELAVSDLLHPSAQLSGSRGLCPLSEPGVGTEIQHTGTSNPWLLALLLPPSEHLVTSWADSEKEEEPPATPALPLCFPVAGVLTPAHAFLASASAISKLTPVHAGNQGHFQITYSLTFHFKITIFFFPGLFLVYTSTKNTGKVQVTAINEI